VTVGALAAHLGLVVEADEREARIFVVGEGPRARAALHVATSAPLVRELALVHAPVLVTGHAAALLYVSCVPLPWHFLQSSV